MGTVYLARSRGGRAVAVKVARPELASDPSFRARFRAEVAAARQVGGFHTAQVVDADPEAESPWLATAYIPGPTLSGLLTAQGPMDEARLRSLGAALAEALEAIHACGLVHRDLKPGNIVMASDGPRVLDFGIARALESTRLTATGNAFGTPGYLAPEQALGEEVTGAADVFALGAVLVAAAGGKPFGEGTPMGLMYRSVHEAPDLGAVPEALRGLVGRCLDKNPAERPTPDAIMDELAGAPTAVPDPRVAPAGPPLLPAPAPEATPADAVPVPADAAPTPSDAVPMPADAAPLPAPSDAVPVPMPAPAAAVPPAPDHALPTRTAGVQDAVPAPVPVPGPAPVPHPVPQYPATFYVPPPPFAPPPPPEFAAADRNSGIAVDGTGVSLHFFGEEADFLWDEVGAVRYERIRRGRVLRVAVTLYDGSSYDCEVDGRSAARVEGWVRLLDPVLRHYLPA
ncbi:serine/threonine-protein kinase [Streptomyces vietnamensis]|uniref:serine/threonine-protein kinase n=1 Tax=Streptomyces vietnamensis TaxID=362257 RepID=UPI0037B0D86B